MAETDDRTASDPPLFGFAGREVHGSEVLRAADVRGALTPPWQAFLAGRTALEACVDRGPPLEPSDVEAATEAFRYEHGLITAEETEAWFEERGLALEELDAYARRKLARERLESKTPSGTSDPWAAPPEVRASFRAELMLSGELGLLAYEFACRLVNARAHPGDASPSPAALEGLHREFLDRQGLDPAALAAWFARSGASAEELQHLLALEAAFRLRSGELTTPKARERMRVSLRIALIQVERESLTVGSNDAAREAVLCIREDGRTMAELANENAFPYERETLVLEDLDEESQRALLSATPGELLDPVEEGPRIRVSRLVAKREPEASDPEALRRIDRAILDAHFADLTAQHVRWRLGGPGGA